MFYKCLKILNNQGYTFLYEQHLNVDGVVIDNQQKAYW